MITLELTPEEIEASEMNDATRNPLNIEPMLKKALQKTRDIKDALNWLKDSGKPDWCRRMGLEVVDDVMDIISDLLDRLDDVYPIYKQAMIENNREGSRVLYGDDEDFLDPFGGSTNDHL